MNEFIKSFIWVIVFVFLIILLIVGLSYYSYSNGLSKCLSSSHEKRTYGDKQECCYDKVINKDFGYSIKKLCYRVDGFW